jgi:hypothetical protein
MQLFTTFPSALLRPHVPLNRSTVSGIWEEYLDLKEGEITGWKSTLLGLVDCQAYQQTVTLEDYIILVRELWKTSNKIAKCDVLRVSNCMYILLECGIERVLLLKFSHVDNVLLQLFPGEVVGTQCYRPAVFFQHLPLCPRLGGIYVE